MPAWEGYPRYQTCSFADWAGQADDGETNLGGQGDRGTRDDSGENRPSLACGEGKQAPEVRWPLALFSLGTVLYEMATRSRAFPGASTAEIFASILGTTPIPPSRVNRAIPQGFDRILERLLEIVQPQHSFAGDAGLRRSCFSASAPGAH